MIVLSLGLILSKGGGATVYSSHTKTVCDDILYTSTICPGSRWVYPCERELVGGNKEPDRAQLDKTSICVRLYIDAVLLLSLVRAIGY